MAPRALDPSFGYTTGSCAAAASKAAARMLFSKENVNYVNLITPGEYQLNIEILDIQRLDRAVSCAVRKDSGEDPDITNGTLVYARVELISEREVQICGGTGVGKVTKPGLDQPVGEWAINSGPRAMIQKALLDVAKEYGYEGGFRTTISIPDGIVLAEKTFNPRLGIVGGISVLGTTGIVEPMSDQALIDTIRVEMRVKKAEGDTLLWMAPGNYGQAFLQQQYGFEIDKAVKCSNFIGDSVAMAQELGFSDLILTGHLGKLVKVAAGIMNTHSKYGDHRMETLVQVLKDLARTDQEIQVAELEQQILECVTTEEAVRILLEHGCLHAVMTEIARRIRENLEKQGPGLHIEIILFSSEYGLLAQTEGVKQLLEQ